MSKEFLFDTKETGFVVSAQSNGDHTLGELLVAVKMRVNGYAFGAKYEMESLAFNIECVVRDVKAKRIPNPETFEGWVSAIEAEYKANVDAVSGALASGRIAPDALKPKHPTTEALETLESIKKAYPKSSSAD